MTHLRLFYYPLLLSLVFCSETAAQPHYHANLEKEI